MTQRVRTREEKVTLRREKKYSQSYEERNMSDVFGEHALASGGVFEGENRQGFEGVAGDAVS